MPSLATFARCVIRVYKNEHGVPHFHILAPDFAAVVEIGTLRIIEGDRAQVRRYAQDALTWAETHRDVILEAWHQFNPGR